MEKPRVLSGAALVAKGITKVDATLPEIGLKDVTPNGSWLEQKQIQAALEARKYLVEVERIEKCGTLSHADWHDDLKLAEVTQKTGGHWQYLGHNVGKKLYLQPEEALFLMEVNCLLLKHNEVTVSLQKAYSLLLSSSTTLIQYKVYASLSRLGYKIFRHTGPKVDEASKNDSHKHEINSVDPVTVIDLESKNNDSPTTDKSQSEDVDSPFVEIKHTENDNSSKANTEKELENVDSSLVSNEEESENSNIVPIVSKVNNSENVISTKTLESAEISTVIECEKSESGVPVEITVSDVNKDNNSIVETVIDTEMTETPKDDSDERSDKRELHTYNTLSEKKLDVKDNETNGNIVQITEDKDSKEIAEQFDTENSVTKENESPNTMEVDECTELKPAENKIESIETSQEVSSTIADIKENAENKINSMEICTENQHTDIVSMEVSVDTAKNIEAASTTTSTEEQNSMIASDTPNDFVEVVATSENAVSASNSEVEKTSNNNTGTLNNVGSAKLLKEVPNKTDSSDSNNCISTKSVTQFNFYNKEDDTYNYLAKIEKLTKRQLKPIDSKIMEVCFENVPDFSKGRIVVIHVPEQQYIPKNIFVNKSTYILNLQNIKMRTIRSASSDSPAYTSSDEVNGTNIRRIRSSSDIVSTEFSPNQSFFPQARFTRFNHFRPYGYWRHQNNHNIFQLMFFQTRVQYHQWAPRLPRISIHPNLHVSQNARKRMRNGKSAHMQSIKNLAVRMKQSLISGNTDMNNLQTLHSLLHSYNLRYKARLRLTEHFDVINEEKIMETIELDDDEESKSKKPRLEKEDNKFDENLNRLRQLALRLRDLEIKDKATASHRRAFSKAIKTFNKSYNADVYLDDDSYEVIDRRCITLDSSSESDCVVEEQVKVRSKKLRNPFNILKRRKERLQSLNNPSTSKNNDPPDHNKTDPVSTEADGENRKYNEFIRKTFSKAWLPNEKDFGRAEIVPRRSMTSRLEISNKEQFLYDYMKDHLQPYENWLEAKLSFLRYLEETSIAFKSQKARILADAELCNTGLKPLIDFEDSSDLPSVLEKLRIIENNKEIAPESSLKIDFDVYNRNVQNFRKRNPPKPHFRIICVEARKLQTENVEDKENTPVASVSSGVPSAAHVMSLHSKYEDNVPIVFAIVSTDSISYLQINPMDLPVYVPNNDVE